MYSKLLLSLGAGLWALLWAFLAQADALTIVVNNIKSDKGAIMLQVMQGESAFNGEAIAIAQLQQKASPPSMTFSTDGLPNGEYAIRVMHDKNDNGKLDSNFVGVPKEPWAFSNNASGKFGPPKWDDAKFVVSGDTIQNIELN